MKYVLSFVGLIAVVCAFVFCGVPKSQDEEYIRLHITANSNSIADQNIKYTVKDAVVKFLNEKLTSVESKSIAKQTILSNLNEIERVVFDVLSQNDAGYLAKVFLSQEEYPTRSYANGVLEGGTYESLKIDLGKAEGDNWWCCVFPAVCIL
ncbi:MAG: stage II sporulation protein R [Candidatus Caccovivens sp.]